MGTSYSGWVATDDWRLQIDYSQSSPGNSNKATITVRPKIITKYGYQKDHPVVVKITVNGSTQTQNIWATSANNGFWGSNANFSVPRTHSTKSYSISASASIPGSGAASYVKGTSVSASISVSAATSYTYTFNPNGGTINGGTGNVTGTKWYGENFTIPSYTMARTNYTFLGWSTDSAATTASYAPGAAVGDNSAMTFYAVWELSYIAPTISSITAARCDANGNEADDGTYAYIKANWAVSQVVVTDNTLSKITARYKLSTSDAWSDETVMNPNGTSSGTATLILNGNFSADNAYNIQVIAYDYGGSVTSSTIIAQQFYTMDFRSGGKGIAFGHSAIKDGIDVGMDMSFSNPNQVRSALGISGIGVTTEWLYKTGPTAPSRTGDTTFTVNKSLTYFNQFDLLVFFGLTSEWYRCSTIVSRDAATNNSYDKIYFTLSTYNANSSAMFLKNTLWQIMENGNSVNIVFKNRDEAALSGGKTVTRNSIGVPIAGILGIRFNV